MEIDNRSQTKSDWFGSFHASFKISGIQSSGVSDFRRMNPTQVDFVDPDTFPRAHHNYVDTSVFAQNAPFPPYGVLERII